jgi:hypothetical protein
MLLLAPLRQQAFADLAAAAAAWACGCWAADHYSNQQQHRSQAVSLLRPAAAAWLSRWGCLALCCCCCRLLLLMMMAALVLLR